MQHIIVWFICQNNPDYVALTSDSQTSVVWNNSGFLLLHFLLTRHVRDTLAEVSSVAAHLGVWTGRVWLPSHGTRGGADSFSPPEWHSSFLFMALIKVVLWTLGTSTGGKAQSHPVCCRRELDHVRASSALTTLNNIRLFRMARGR